MKKGISLTTLAKTTVDAAHASGRVLMKHYQKRLVVGEKMGAGLVTNADMESEAAALKILRSRFPHFATLTEESSPEPGSSTRTYAGAPHRSHKSRAVSGLVGAIAPVISRLLASWTVPVLFRCRFIRLWRQRCRQSVQPVNSLRITTPGAAVCHPLWATSMPRANIQLCPASP